MSTAKNKGFWEEALKGVVKKDAQKKSQNNDFVLPADRGPLEKKLKQLKKKEVLFKKNIKGKVTEVEKKNANAMLEKKLKDVD